MKPARSLAALHALNAGVLSEALRLLLPTRRVRRGRTPVGEGTRPGEQAPPRWRGSRTPPGRPVGPPPAPSWTRTCPVGGKDHGADSRALPAPGNSGPSRIYPRAVSWPRRREGVKPDLRGLSRAEQSLREPDTSLRWGPASGRSRAEVLGPASPGLATRSRLDRALPRGTQPRRRGRPQPHTYNSSSDGQNQGQMRVRLRAAHQPRAVHVGG